jgi:hypothetical protein
MATVIKDIDLRMPDNTGDAFWLPLALTAHDMGAWQFLENVDSSVYGFVTVPENLAGTPNASIELQLAANATTGVTSMNVLYSAIADGESFNPGSLTSVGIVDVSVPATAYLRKQQTFALTGLVAEDMVIIEILHNGLKAEDTLAVPTLLVGAYLSIDVV